MRTIASAVKRALCAGLVGLAALFGVAGPAQAQNAIDLNNLVEFNANIQPTFSNLRFNTRTGATTIKVTLTNLSAVDVPAPIYLAIMNISSLSARVDNATGIDVNGTPFFVVGQTLQPGQAVSFDVLFGNTGRNRFTFTPRAFGVVADLFVTIDDPLNLALTNQSLVDVSGKTTPGASVTVNGIDAVVMGDTYTVADVPLTHEGSNALSATAQDAMGHVANVASSVIRDTTPPTVVIGFPHEGAVVFNDTISVQAAVNDPIAGLMMAAPPTATVNGIPAAFENGSLVAPSVQLTPGSNTITVDVTDPAGNASQAVVHVTYDDTAVAKILVFSGNDQSAPISQLLPQPLVAQLLDQAGAPVAGTEVIFRVVMSNGVFTDSTRITSTMTDANGLASVSFIGGSRTGQGCNSVEASAALFQGTAQFISTSTGGSPAKISASQGEMQRAAVSSQAPMALVAFVTDVGNNPLPGIKVIFNVVAGGGHFAENDGTALGVTTDMMGRVSAILVTGPLQGVENNLVEAKIEQAPQFTPVRFAVTSLTPGDPAQTTFSGLVLDHTDTPLPNVHIHMDPGNLTTFTDAAGQFTLTNVQVGPVHLTADATTTTTPGTWGTLSFERVTIPGTDNSLGMPIHMLPMFLNNPIAGGDQDVTLLLPELPGFHLKVFANSCTFPNGDRTGLVSVTAVRTDKIPMPPADGMSPNFIITVQPPDVLFSPPAEFAVPNVEGLVPGEMTNMFSFDHDLGRFVSIGPGTCSEDGTVIVSQPGFGIVKAGWHCAGPSRPQGQAEPTKVTINGEEAPKPLCLTMNQTKVLTAVGTPQPPKDPAKPYTWTINAPGVMLTAGTLNSASITVKATTNFPMGSITVAYTCESGETDTATLQLGGAIRIIRDNDNGNVNDDPTLTILNVSNFPTDEKLTMDGRADVDNFKLEINCPGIMGDTIPAAEVAVEALKPNGSRFAPPRMINAACTRVAGTEIFRSMYLRLVVDDVDQAANAAQTLVTDWDSTDDTVEILGQKVKASYMPAGGMMATAEATVCENFKSIPVAVHWITGSAGVSDATARTRVLKWVRRLYAQTCMRPKLLSVGEAKPVRNVVAISQDTGRPAVGDGDITMTLVSDRGGGTMVTWSVTYRPMAGHTPKQTADALETLIEALPPSAGGTPADRLTVQTFENPKLSIGVGKSADLLIKDSNAAGMLTVMAVATADTGHDRVVAPLAGAAMLVGTGTNHMVGSVQQRAIIYNYDAGATTFDIFISNTLDYEDLSTSIRGRANIASKVAVAGEQLAVGEKPIDPFRNNVYVVAEGADGTDNNPFSMPHELGHCLNNAGHVTNDDKQMMRASTTPMNAVGASKRIADASRTFQGGTMLNQVNQMRSHPMVGP